MHWRHLIIAGLAASISACGAAGETVRSLTPFTPEPAPRAERLAVTDPAPFVRGTLRPYQIRGIWYTPEIDEDYDRTGVASWYGDAFHGRPTATGEIFDMNLLTAAHTTLPIPCLVEVTNLSTGQSIIVRVNDRGPFVDNRIIDLSRGAADALGVRSQGLAEVRVRYLGPAPRTGGGQILQQASRDDRPARTDDSQARDQADHQRYYVQAGTFANRDNAESLRRRLGREGLVQVEDVRIGGERMYRVLIGPWTGRREAERQRSTLAGQGLFDAILVRAD